MLRRTTFKRPERVRPPMAPPTPIRRGVVSRCDEAGPAQPKTAPKRNRALLDLAKGMPCLLLVPGCCNHRIDTTVACHSNLSCHGKAGVRKADDQYSVCGCSACHAWLDQGRATAAQKEAVFMAAHNRQVMAWRQFAAGPDGKAQRAAAWALDELGAWPVGWPLHEKGK